MQVTYGELQEQITQPVQAVVPDTERYQLLEAETALVYPTGDRDYHDPIMHMVWSTLEESVIEGLQKRFLNLLTHRQASNKFDTIEQGQKTVQELI